MAWIIFFSVSVIAAMVLVPVKHWKRLWPAGIIGVIVLYIIDSTLIRLGAFGYSTGIQIYPSIPLLYCLSGFSGGLIIIKYYPNEKKQQLLYVTAASVAFLIMELAMNYFGFFHYYQWNAVNSFILNLFGFIVTLWISEHLISKTRKTIIK